MPTSHIRERGGALVIVLFMMVMVTIVCLATLALSSSETKSAVVAKKRVQALFVAEAGVERQIQSLRDLLGKVGLVSPFYAVDPLAGATTFDAQTLSKDGVSVGQYTVVLAAVEAVDASTRDVTIRSQGFVPSADAPNRVSRTVTATVRLQLGRSGVFDYVYFINNWGWFYSGTIDADGNVRANGQFDCANYRPNVNGVQIYEHVNGTDIEGLLTGGGIFAGWDIIADNVQGTARQIWTVGDAEAGRCTPEQVGTWKNQHDFVDQLPMPNLTDLTVYEDIAKAQNSWIKVGSQVVCGPVLGDDPGEKQHLYLEGTAENPIWINGPVVVRGSVIIKGVVKGQGFIYSGGNVYVPDNLAYEDGPMPLPEPSIRNETALENWLAHNQDKDFLGLFAREHIVVGDYTDSTWRYYVQRWLDNSKNKSAEDAGLDLIPNTRAGKDGVLGTADDDVLEDDGVWTVGRYTQEDADGGLIPPGKNVGDPIPGSGEDIDGDGQYDGTTSLSEFTVPAAVCTSNWAGNAPVLPTSYSQLATTGVYQLDAAFYTNHAFAMYTGASTKHFVHRGCIVSRNESIIYNTLSLDMNYDYRLIGGDPLGSYLPKTWRIQVVVWTSD